MELPKKYFNTAQAAQYTGLAAATLEKLRHFGEGPVFIRRPGGRRVVYFVEDLDVWLQAGRRTSTSDRGDGNRRVGS